MKKNTTGQVYLGTGLIGLAVYLVSDKHYWGIALGLLGIIYLLSAFSESINN